MLVVNSKKDVIICINNIEMVEIVRNNDKTKFVIVVRVGFLCHHKLYESPSKKKCQEMLNSIVDSYEQGVKVFRI